MSPITKIDVGAERAGLRVEYLSPCYDLGMLLLGHLVHLGHGAQTAIVGRRIGIRAIQVLQLAMNLPGQEQFPSVVSLLVHAFVPGEVGHRFDFILPLLGGYGGGVAEDLEQQGQQVGHQQGGVCSVWRAYQRGLYRLLV